MALKEFSSCRIYKKVGLLRFLSLSVSLLVLSSCSSILDKKEEVATPKISEESSNEILNSELVEKTRIVGSAKIGNTGRHHSRRTYYLYGGEHLKLDNYYFDIPIVYNKAVKKWLKYFQGRARGIFERYSERAGRYAPILGKILEDCGLPRDLIFLAMAESGFRNDAKSWAKAVGPWQFMRATGKRFGLKINWYIDERRDPIKATIAAGRYLKKLYGDFGSWELAATAYNAGEGKVGRAIRRYKTENFWQLRKGRYLKPETKNYLPKIMALAIIGKNLKAFGFEDISFHDPLDFDEVKLPPFTDLIVFAERTGISYEEIQRLNPEILRWFTPPNQEYILRVPAGMGHIDGQLALVKSDFRASSFQNYKIRGSRATLAAVAKKFKVKPYVLETLNKMSAKTRLKRGQKVVLPFRLGQSRRAKMYADLYEKPRKSVIRKRQYRRRIKLAKRRGKRIINPTQYYTVKKGDTLWTVARKVGVSLDTLIVSNLRLINNRMIRAGDRLVVR